MFVQTTVCYLGGDMARFAFSICMSNEIIDQELYLFSRQHLPPKNLMQIILLYINKIFVKFQ